MRKFWLSVFAVLLTVQFSAALMAQGAPPQGGADQPYTVEYYYKVQWGHQQEFLDLFLKNHYPLLQKIVDHGAHALGEDRGALPTTPPKMAAGITASRSGSRIRPWRQRPIPDEEAMIKELWPDQATYKKEEQRRFEILAAHWDLPVTEITPKK